MILGTLIARPLLEFLDTPASIIDWCTDYLVIFFLGAAGFTFYNVLSGVLRGMGDSLSALLFLLVAAALNTVLDLWFVAGLGLGVAGVSLATVIAQAISAFLCFIKLMRMGSVFDLTLDSLRMRKDSAWRIVKLGVPSGITQGIMAVAMMVVQSLTNSMGEVVIACNVIIMRVDGFAMMPNMSFGQTMSVYAGQNVGAGRLDRVTQGTRQGLGMAVGFSAAITAVLLLFGHILFDLFTDTPELMDLAVRMMRILAAGYLCMAVTQVLGGVMRGCGDTMTPMWITMLTTIVLRIPTAYGLAYLTRCEAYPNGRPEALFTSLLFSWAMGALVSWLVFRRESWKKKALAACQPE